VSSALPLLFFWGSGETLCFVVGYVVGGLSCFLTEEEEEEDDACACVRVGVDLAVSAGSMRFVCELLSELLRLAGRAALAWLLLCVCE
jgi:hypothetical protein